MLSIRPKTIAKVIWRVLRFLLLLWLALFLFQRHLIYQPSKDTLENITNAAKEASFELWEKPNGEQLGLQSITPSNDPREPLTILVVHGNAGSALDRTGIGIILREALPERAISLYIMEYPGYGARPGKPSQESFLSAASEALEQIPGKDIIILGESIGTSVACALAAEAPDRVSGLLLLTPFDSLASVAQGRLPFMPAHWLLLDQFPSQQWLRSYTGPVVVFAAGKDSVVPTRHALKLYQDYHGPKKLVEAAEAGHNDILALLSPLDWQRSIDFLEKESNHKPLAK